LSIRETREPAVAHADLVRSYYQDALNTGRFKVLDDLLSADFVEHEHVPGIPPTGAGIAEKYTLLRTGFPDLRFTIEDLFHVGDRVAVRTTVAGTHTGEFRGLAPTGRRFDVTAVGIFRIQDGRIVEHWGVFDQVAMLADLQGTGQP
jgi:steroid delta-isomerase-like uncharacterized protein